MPLAYTPQYFDTTTQRPLDPVQSKKVSNAIELHLYQQEKIRTTWIGCSLDDQIAMYMLHGTEASNWLHSAASTITFSTFTALHWNMTDAAPDVRLMRRAVDVIRHAVVHGGCIITPDVLKITSRALDIARENILRRAPVHAMQLARQGMQRAIAAM